MKLRNLKINGLDRPIGYDCSELLLSWQVEGSSAIQSNASIKMWQGEAVGEALWQLSGDLNWEGTRLDTACLRPRSRYTIQVEVSDSEGKTCTGETFFETGKMTESWKAKWIKPNGKSDWAPILEGRFASSGELKEARLYILGLGIYTAELNGQKVSEELLAPGFWHYEKEAPYQSYDVSGLIKEDNCLAVTLGNGWYKGRFGLEHQSYSEDYALIAELHLRYTDGREESFVTDESWTWSESDISASNSIYDGEKLDRLAHADEKSEPCPVETMDEPLKIVERFSPPVVESMSLPVAEVLHTPAGETVLDFGQNHAGLLRFRSALPKGCEVHFDFGEVLQQGNFYNENYRSALGGFTYRSDGREETVCQLFTFYGFRYVRVTGWPGEIRAKDFESPVIHTLLERIGYLETGHENLNRLYENVLWGQRSNFLSMPTDCPQRDERLGWTGDAQVFAPTACYNMDCRAFYRSFLRLLRLDQLDNGGSIAVCLPRSPGFASCGIWGDAATLIPETLERFSGSLAEVEPWYPMMKDWVDFVCTKSHSYLYDDEQLGDWLALDGVTDQSFKGGTDDTYLGSLYWMNSARIVARLAEKLGYAEDAEKYSALAENIRTAVLDNYFTASGRLSVDTQAAYIAALRFGVWRDKSVLTEQFMRRMRFDGFELRCGFAGAPVICSVLAEHGMEDLACELLLRRGFPGWMYCVELGATTVWERWNSLLPDGTCSGTGMNSFNHYAYGSVMEYVYGHLAGIRPGSRGFRNAIIAPKPHIRLGHVNCRVNTLSGEYTANWRICPDGKLEVHIEVPFGCCAQVTLPRSGKESFSLGPGSYDYSYMPETDYRKLYTIDSRLGELADNEKAKSILLEEAPALFGVLMEGNREFTTQSFRQLSGAFFLGMNPQKIEALVSRLKEIQS